MLGAVVLTSGGGSIRARGLPTVLVAAVAAGVAAVGASAHTYVYTVESRGEVRSDLDEFARIAESTLAGNTARGWALRGAVTFERVSSRPQFRLVLASPAAVAAAAPVCSRRWSCRVGDSVLVNDDRWRNGTDTWTKSLHDYRHYVVNHEVGHWLGLRHDSCTGSGNLAPVMQQQSISLQGCRANTWPLRYEKRLVADELGLVYPPWPIPIPNWYWPWVRWYLGRGEFADAGRRAPGVRPDAAPRRIPEWGWRRLKVLLGNEAGAHVHRSGIGARKPWPVPIPAWYWGWVQWYLGEGDFKDTPFRSGATRPDAAPHRIPDWGWRRLKVLLVRRGENE